MGSVLEIRAFSEDDYVLLSTVDAAAYDDDPRAAELWKHDDATRNPALFFQRHVVSVDGSALACGSFGHSDWIDDPHKYWFQILVSPDFAGGLIRQRYLDFALTALAPRHPRALVSGMVESYEAHTLFLEANGFDAVHREHYSRLEMSGFDRNRHREAVTRVQGLGIELVRLADLAVSVPDWKERLHPVFQQLVADQPAPDPPRLETLDEWERTTLGAPDFDPRLWIVARNGLRIVGLSQAMVSPEAPTIASCGLTGVIGEYRRRGIATALKVELLAAAKKRGVVRISTSNEENNPMYRINVRLGFCPRPDWVMYERRL